MARSEGVRDPKNLGDRTAKSMITSLLYANLVLQMSYVFFLLAHEGVKLTFSYGF